MIITESGMNFGDYPEENVFHIEKCEDYKKMKGNCVKIAEFILLEGDKLRILEAKTSAPNPQNQEKPQRFRDFIKEIEEKMCNSLDLFLYEVMRHAVNQTFLNIDYNKCKFTFILVIKNHKIEWCMKVKEALETALNQYIRIKKIWKCEVLVLNEQQAVQHKLVTDNSDIANE